MMVKRYRQRVLSLVSVPHEVIRSCYRDRINTEAASIAYYFFLSFFPMILTLFSLTGLLGREAAFDWIMNEFLVALPDAASEAIGEFVHQVTMTRSASALSIGLLLTVWTASNIFAVLADGLNQAYQAQRRHRWWKRRAMALALLLILAGALIVLAVIVLAGPAISKVLQFEDSGHDLLWPLTFLLAVAMMWLIYYWLPNHDQSRSKRWILVGALVGTILWIGATLLFRLFLSYSSRFTAIYGLVGGIAAFLIWLYLTAMCVLVGGEIAAVMERRATASRRLRRSVVESELGHEPSKTTA
jgi:membrane protein